MSAMDFLGAVIPALEGNEWVELRTSSHQTGEVWRQWYRHPAPLIRDAARQAQAGYHVWCGINPRNGRTGGDKNTSRSAALPADIDGKLWGSLAAAENAVRTFEPAPQVGVMSGGGVQCYWLLDGPLDLQHAPDAARYRVVSHRLAWALCGIDRQPDRVNNPERVLRLPGTLNWKYDPPRPVELLWCDPSVRYAVAELEEWLDQHAPWTAPEPIHIPERQERATGGVIADFNSRYDAVGLLVAHGACVQSQRAGVTLLTRPGKSHGISATWGHVRDTLIVFTEQWSPFDPWRVPGQQRRGYDAFEVFTLLEHGGDHGRAYHAAFDAGYGRKVICGLQTYTKHAASTLRALCGGGSQ